MTDKSKLQIEIEKIHVDENKLIPATWKWQKNESGLFYLEPSTGKKRYGFIKECLNCERNFLCRNNWANKAFFCSKICSALIRQDQINIACAWCKKDISRTKSKLQNSKHGFHFCDRKCKEEAQSIGGIEEIQPNHYQDGTKAYSERAFKHYGYKCVDCNITMKNFLQVHHIDADRDNGSLENLEVVCNIHHLLRHMKYEKEESKWTVNYKYLTPRDKLDELRTMLVAQNK